MKAFITLPTPARSLGYLAQTRPPLSAQGEGGWPALIYDSPRAITLPLTLIQQFIYWHASRYRQRWAAYMQETSSWTFKLQIGFIFLFRWERARATGVGCNNHLMPCCCCSASADTDSALSVIWADRRNESRLTECRCSVGRDERRPLARSPARRHGWSVPCNPPTTHPIAIMMCLNQKQPKSWQWGRLVRRHPASTTCNLQPSAFFLACCCLIRKLTCFWHLQISINWHFSPRAALLGST